MAQIHRIWPEYSELEQQDCILHIPGKIAEVEHFAGKIHLPWLSLVAAEEIRNPCIVHTVLEQVDIADIDNMADGKVGTGCNDEDPA